MTTTVPNAASGPENVSKNYFATPKMIVGSVGSSRTTIIERVFYHVTRAVTSLCSKTALNELTSCVNVQKLMLTLQSYAKSAIGLVLKTVVFQFRQASIKRS